MSQILRGTSSSPMRTAVCKDCQREIDALGRQLDAARTAGDTASEAKLLAELSQRDTGVFSYSEHSASNVINRGGSRSDRCTAHRAKHRSNIQGMAVAYVDLRTLGEAVGAHDDEGPAGPFGGLGPLPGKHESEPRTADLAQYEFGMNDKDIVEILELLRDKRVLVLKAGTGTGKSTFGPFRLMDPPTMEDLERLGIVDDLLPKGIDLRKNGLFRLTDLGPIIVTEPRVAAATGVSRFVGEKLAMGCVLKQCAVPEHGTFNPKAHPDGPGGLRGASCPDIDHSDPAQKCTRDHVGAHPWPKTGKCVVTDCYSHVGPGFPVGYQVSGDRNHDDACQLVFVTDGTMINWLREGRLSRIGTVIVDEAHERSTNIDFIMGFLRRNLDKYPHLKVIITSATFEPKFYEEFFGGPTVVAVKEVPAVKTVGYGMPLFPDLDHQTAAMRAYLAASPKGTDDAGGSTEAAATSPDDPTPATETPTGRTWTEQAVWPLAPEADPQSASEADRFISTHWPITDSTGAPLLDQDGQPLRSAKAPRLKENEVVPRSERSAQSYTEVPDTVEVGHEEDLWDTTRKLLPLRFGAVPSEQPMPPEQWKERMPETMASYIVRLARGLDDARIFGDILGFLPTARTIKETCDAIRSELGDDADVCELVSSLTEQEIENALSARRYGDKRKIVISTNLAETSLTVEGVRFVVDSGLIAQSDWNAELASGGVGTKLHSRSGIKQRWGRVGRKVPGWVFPLYTKEQFADLPEDTPPGSARENLEQLMMTARMGGIDDVKSFPWPAAFNPTTVELDASATKARSDFLAELDRADKALRGNGAVDKDGHPTTFGKELVRFSGVGTASSAIALMYADRLGCVPEVAMIMALLEGTRLVGAPDSLLPRSYEWPDEWQVEAANRHRAIARVAEDDAHLVLLIAGAWERSDPKVPPWEESRERRAWARTWWINNEVLLEAAKKRQAALAALSPAMKEEVKRFVEPALLDRSRAVLARTMSSAAFRREGDTFSQVDPIVTYKEDGTPRTPPTYTLEKDALTTVSAGTVLALRRRENGADASLSNLVVVPTEPELLTAGSDAASSVADAMAMVLAFKKHAAPDSGRNVVLELMKRYPVGLRFRMVPAAAGTPVADIVERQEPFERTRTPEENKQDGIAEKRQQRQQRARRYRSREHDDDGASRSDANGDLGLRFRTGVDDEARAQRAFEAADRLTGELAGCGTCDDCQLGRRCGVTVEDVSSGTAVDVVRTWREPLDERVRAALAAAVMHVTDGSTDEGFFEVTGYQDAEGAVPKITVVRDWRPVGADPDPAKHLEVEPGKTIPVRVAGWVEDHQSSLRVFERVDGLGRFLLREAAPGLGTQRKRNQIAVSLCPGAQNLLEDLEAGTTFVATAVPARVEDRFTITLLDTFYHHLQQARSALPTVEINPDDPTQGRAAVFPAKVLTPPDANGYMTFRSLIEDAPRGLVYDFQLNVSPRVPRGEPKAPRSEWVNFEESEPWQLLLSRHEPELDVSGMDLDEIEDIKFEAANQLRLQSRQRSKPDGDSSDSRLLDTSESARPEGEQRVAPSGTIFRSVGAAPLHYVIAVRLAELDDGPEWQNTVWAFWARSHHLEVRDAADVFPGSSLSPVQLDLAPRKASGATPKQEAKQRINDLGCTTGDVVRGTVTDVFAFGARVELDGGAEVFVPIAEFSWNWISKSTDAVQMGRQVELQLTKVDLDRGDLEGSIRALTPDPLREFADKNPPGKAFGFARVKAVEETHAVLLDRPAFKVIVRPSELKKGSRPDSIRDVLAEGQRVPFAIIDYEFARRRVVVSIKRAAFWAFQKSYGVGTTARGVVRKIDGRFADVELDGDVHGSVHINEVTGSKIASFDGHLAVGQTYDFRVVGFKKSPKGDSVQLARFNVLPWVEPASPAPLRPAAAPQTSAPPSAPEPAPAPAPAKAPAPADAPERVPAERRRRRRWAVAEASTAREATRVAMDHLGLTGDQVRVEILDRGQDGPTGERRPWVIRVSEK